MAGTSGMAAMRFGLETPSARIAPESIWGLAVSALEMQQNASRDSWTFAQSEQRLRETMRDIHARCWDTAEEYGLPGDYVAGANINGFRRVAEAMLAHGLV